MIKESFYSFFLIKNEMLDANLLDGMIFVVSSCTLLSDLLYDASFAEFYNLNGPVGRRLMILGNH